MMRKIISSLVIGALCVGNQGFCAVSALKSPLRNRAISNKTSVKAKTNVRQKRVKISKRKSYRKNLRNFARKVGLKTKLALKNHKKLLSLGTSAIAAGSVFAYRLLRSKKNPSVGLLEKAANSAKAFPLETCLVVTGAPICILGVACMLKKTDNASTPKKTPDPSNQPYYPNSFNPIQVNTSSDTSEKPKAKPDDNKNIEIINNQTQEVLDFKRSLLNSQKDSKTEQETPDPSNADDQDYTNIFFDPSNLPFLNQTGDVSSDNQSNAESKTTEDSVSRDLDDVLADDQSNAEFEVTEGFNQIFGTPESINTNQDKQDDTGYETDGTDQQSLFDDEDDETDDSSQTIYNPFAYQQSYLPNNNLFNGLDDQSFTEDETDDTFQAINDSQDRFSRSNHIRFQLAPTSHTGNGSNDVYRPVVPSPLYEANNIASTNGTPQPKSILVNVINNNGKPTDINYFQYPSEPDTIYVKQTDTFYFDDAPTNSTTPKKSESFSNLKKLAKRDNSRKRSTLRKCQSDINIRKPFRKLGSFIVKTFSKSNHKKLSKS